MMMALPMMADVDADDDNDDGRRWISNPNIRTRWDFRSSGIVPDIQQTVQTCNLVQSSHSDLKYCITEIRPIQARGVSQLTIDNIV